jgi:protein-S-isoprenylcysteine O-methyltransferase Ste14
VIVPAVAPTETTIQSSRGVSLIRLLFDRVLPSLIFGCMAMVQSSAFMDGVQRSPTDSDVAVWLIHLLNMAHRTLALLFLALITVLFLIRRAPRGRRAGPLSMALALLGTFIMYLAAGQPLTTQEWTVLAAADLLMVGGLAFTVYAAASLRHCFGLAAEARGLVTTGAYRLVRHPLYLGELIVFVGMVLPMLAPSTASIFALFCLFQAARANLEERVLEATFADYAAYRRRTPALIPWLRP